MNGLNNFDKTDKEYSLAPFDDLNGFLRSNVKVTAGLRVWWRRRTCWRWITEVHLLVQSWSRSGCIRRRESVWTTAAGFSRLNAESPNKQCQDHRECTSVTPAGSRIITCCTSYVCVIPVRECIVVACEIYQRLVTWSLSSASLHWCMCVSYVYAALHCIFQLSAVYVCLGRLKIPVYISSTTTILRLCSSPSMSCNCLGLNKPRTLSRSVDIADSCTCRVYWLKNDEADRLVMLQGTESLCYLLSTHADSQGVDLLFTVCFLFVCTVTDIFGEDKASGVKFCTVV